MSITVSPKWFQETSKNFLIKIGSHKEVASDCAKVMTSASLRGIDTHGTAMLPKILKRVQDKRCFVNEPSKIIESSKRNAVGIIDAYLAPGQHSCMVASREAVERASQYGIGFVTVRNSTHFGCCSPFLEEILKKRMVGLIGSNSVRSMAAFGLKRPNLGNNPFGFAAPRNDKRDFLFDFSSAVMSFGKRINYLDKGKDLPKRSFIKSEDGENTTSAVLEIADSLEQIALPFGSFKGASVAVMIEVFSGLLSGGHSGSKTETHDEEGKFLGPSHFALAIDPRKFGLKDFEMAVQTYIEEIRRGYEIRLPGDNTEEEKVRRQSEGIPINESLYEEIKWWANELGIQLNL